MAEIDSCGTTLGLGPNRSWKCRLLIHFWASVISQENVTSLAPWKDCELWAFFSTQISKLETSPWTWSRLLLQQNSCLSQSPNDSCQGLLWFEWEPFPISSWVRALSSQLEQLVGKVVEPSGGRASLVDMDHGSWGCIVYPYFQFPEYRCNVSSKPPDPASIISPPC